MKSITFRGYDGELTLYMEKDMCKVNPILVWVGKEEDRHKHIPHISTVNGKHPVYGIWASYCQDDNYANVLEILDIYEIEIE